MRSDLQLGITEKGIIHTDADAPINLDTRFKMVKDSGVYDYYDKTPDSFEQADEYLAASEKYGLPIRAGGWFYRLGQDEALLKRKLEFSARIGSKVHNTQILMHHADGHLVTDEEIVAIYLQAAQWGEACGCYATFEVHINMWSEDFRRINIVADEVEKHGVPFRMTLDHSHVIFKIDNPEEQKIFDIHQAVLDGELVLDPFAPDSVCRQWIERGLVWHAHARAAIPNNPRNIWAKHPDGSVGRGVQYPFIQPQPGQYVADWQEHKLDPWKEVMKQLFRYHASHADSPLGQISTEFIPNPDYGAGHKYSIFENSVACARWLRAAWQEISEEF